MATFIPGLVPVGYAGEAYDAAVAAANSAVMLPYLVAGGDFQLPPGMFRFAGNGVVWPQLAKSSIVRGATNGRTVLQVGPDTSPTVSTTLFEMTGAAVSLQLRNIDLLGPPNYTFGVDANFADTTASFAARAQLGASIEMFDTKASLWLTCFKQENGGALAIRQGSDIRGRVVGALCTEGDYAGSFTCENSSVALDAANGGAVGQCHNFYIHTGYDLSVRGNRFTSANKFALLAGYGGAGTPTSSRIISGNRFSGMPRPVYGGSTGDTVLNENVFDSSADTAMAVIQFSPAGAFRGANNTFIGVPTYSIDQYAVLDDQNGYAAGVLDSCAFSGKFIYFVRRIYAGSVGAIGLRHCTASTVPQVAALGSDVGCGVVDAWRSDFTATGLLCSPTPNNRVRFSECTRAGLNTFSSIG